MARITLKCPIDNTDLGARTAEVSISLRGVLATEVGKHNHLGVVFDLTCSNGHRWTANTELIVERVS